MPAATAAQRGARAAVAAGISIGRKSMSTFTGSITTTGKSQAIRLPKALFRLHPEFRQKAKVRAQVISPGHALISVIDDEAAPAQDGDPRCNGIPRFP